MIGTPQEVSKPKGYNPTKLAYLYPSMPLYKFSKIVGEYHRQQQMGLLIQMSRIASRYLVHRDHLSRQQRAKYEDRQIQIGRQIFYSLDRFEMPRKARVTWDGETIIIP